MVELVELQTIAYIAQTVGVVGTLTAAFIAVRSYINANKRSEEANKKEQETRDRDLDTRQAQLLMQIYDRVNNRDFTRDWGETNYFWKWDDYNDYFKKYGANLEEYPKFQNIIDTYEGIGVILQNKLVDPKLIYGVLRVSPLLYWEKFSPLMKKWGADAGESLMYPGFEFLYEEMCKQYELEHGYKFGYKIRSADDVVTK